MPRHLIAILFIASQCAVAAPMYKVTDKDGNVTYTDTPPSENSQDSSTTVETKPMNVLEGSADQNYQQSFDRRAGQRQQERDSAWKGYDDDIRQAEQKLATARKALKDGESVKEGDFIGVYSNGRQTGVRPSDAFQARRDALKQAVAEAEAELAATKKRRPQLSR